MSNSKKSSADLAKQAAQTLRDDSASKMAKRLAGSVLAQRDGMKRTGADIEDDASMVMRSKKFSPETKALAASVVAQSEKSR